MNLIVIATWLSSAYLLLAPATLHSHLFIAAGKQFLLGGGQWGSFTVSGKNVGPMLVEVKEQLSSGPVLQRGLLAPGRTARLHFAAGPKARLFNFDAQ